MWIEILGWVSQFLFMIAALPQAIKSWRQGHSKGISTTMIGLWASGESLGLVYGILSDIPLPILVNYAVNLIFITIILYYMINPRK